MLGSGRKSQASKKAPIGKKRNGEPPDEIAISPFGEKSKASKEQGGAGRKIGGRIYSRCVPYQKKVLRIKGSGTKKRKLKETP